MFYTGWRMTNVMVYSLNKFLFKFFFKIYFENSEKLMMERVFPKTEQRTKVVKNYFESQYLIIQTTIISNNDGHFNKKKMFCPFAVLELFKY